jgi:hypothetical protein
MNAGDLAWVQALPAIPTVPKTDGIMLAPSDIDLDIDDAVPVTRKDGSWKGCLVPLSSAYVPTEQQKKSEFRRDRTNLGRSRQMWR